MATTDYGFIIGMTLYLLGFAFFAYSCILADPDTSSSARFFTQQLPDYASTKLTNALGPRVMSALHTVGDYALVVIYLIVVLGCWSIVLTHGYELIDTSHSVPSYHKYVGYVVFVACMMSWRKAMSTRPGWITARTIAKYDHFPYDNILFAENKVCRTVGIRKLARSKFDRASGRHVPRFDHYCGWIGNTVGEENYRYFLLFLAVHVGMCTYGTIIVLRCFYDEIVESDLLNATFYLAGTGEEVKASKIVVFQFLMVRHFGLAGALLLMSVMGLVLAAFLSFHLYITAKGMTTNEWYKWRQVKRWHCHAKKEYDAAVKEGRAVETAETKIQVVDGTDGDVGCTGPTGDSDTVGQSKDKEDDTSKKDTNNGVDCDDAVTNPGPFPTNIYDRGIRENFLEVIFPRSLRNDALERWKKAHAEMEAHNSEDNSKGDENKQKVQ